ncbi:nuclear transport factor 2 family protein [Puteibacter caeruleilacunae]|nr:nuclear transport factor 2 family protein [Puteibacter caeruleilacunae]
MNNEIAERNKANTLAFFKALEDMNTDAVVDLFAEDGIHINPYASGIFPDGTKGHAGIKAYWEPVFPNFEKMEFPIDELYAMEDPTVTFVKYKGKIKLKNDVGWYNNDYYSTFKFNEEGKIIEYVEIFNPIVAAKGFGLLDKIK